MLCIPTLIVKCCLEEINGDGSLVETRFSRIYRRNNNILLAPEVFFSDLFDFHFTSNVYLDMLLSLFFKKNPGILHGCTMISRINSPRWPYCLNYGGQIICHHIIMIITNMTIYVSNYAGTDRKRKLDCIWKFQSSNVSPKWSYSYKSWEGLRVNAEVVLFLSLSLWIMQTVDWK